MKQIRIKNRVIGEGNPCFVVAELSGNHHQKFDEAVKLIKAAANAGADAIKLQTYTPDTMTIESNKKWFIVGGKDNPDSWKSKTLYDLYKTAYTPWEWQPKLKKIAEELGLILFSTPFDETAVDFLEKMDVPCYKVASYEATDIPLLEKVAKTGKPVIISVGYANLSEIKEAIATLRKNGTRELAVLHCTTGYSDNPKSEDMNLRTILDIRERFHVVSGFSDNNAGIEIPVMAVAAGAAIVEKHFILKRSSGGPDASFSIEPDELKKMVEAIGGVEKSLGKVHYGPVNQLEKYNRRWRRSIFASSDIKKGEEFTKKNIRVIRPHNGLRPKYLKEVLGKKATKNITKGTPLSWGLVK